MNTKETKKQVKVTTGLHMMGIGEVKAKGDGMIIEGLANKNVIDRGNDIIAVDAWDLENYKKNPVILYNHGMDPQLGATPIGKAVEVKPTKDGLYIKVQLAKVDDPMINRIRGLVEERILKAFSVGFDPKESKVDPHTGVKNITKAELFEVSIVGVPMNQDSLFELTGKMLKVKSVKSIKKDMLEKKGAILAGAIHSRIGEMEKEGVDREAILEAIVEMSGVELDLLMDVLAGNTQPSEELLAAISEVLGTDSLMELAEMPAKEEDDKEEITIEIEKENTDSELDTDEMEEEKDEEDTLEVSEKQADQGAADPNNPSQIAAANTQTENDDFGNPMMDLQKQTNVLLGVLINEIQMLSKKFDKPEQQLEQDGETSVNNVVESEEEQKNIKPVETKSDDASAVQLRLDNYAKTLKNIKNRIDKLTAE